MRQIELWLADPDLEDDSVGLTFATRLCEPDDFAVACAPTIPVDGEMLEQAAADPLALRHRDADQVASDPRFATAIYRAALDCGMFDLALPDEELPQANRFEHEPAVASA